MIVTVIKKSLYRGLCMDMMCWKALTGCKTTNCFRYALSLHSFRGLSTTPCFRELNKPLKQWTLIVNPFTIVKVQLPCNVSVRPLDPHIFPKADRAFVTVNGTSADQGLKLDNFHVKYNEKSKELVILSEKVNSNVSVEVIAPLKCDLDIKTLGEGNVKIQRMECDNCSVLTERGHSVLQSIKGHKVLVHSKEGNIICLGTIHGNVDVHTSRNSLVQITKLQGTRMNISTEHGPLKAKYIYAESSSVSSTSGQIELGNVHGDVTVQNETGNIIIDGSDGCLKASTNEGDIDAYISQFGTAELYSQQGAISVRVPASIKADVQLSGAAVDISPEIPLQEDDTFSEDGHTTVTARLNGKAEGNNWIKAQAAKGTVSLKSQSWFESLKIGKV
ncbi:protein FAM185A isoform X1 [Acipenser ruthenus]|uniref:protein FAM185A isoform X1 n=1 Tax=Acipenser ruthenus TaxID=7906 RepID=UPI00145A74D1|nr:protein FAM185A isoform X1 [Acipenser ruthenus]